LSVEEIKRTRDDEKIKKRNSGIFVACARLSTQSGKKDDQFRT
jgi:hypothetical protein